MTQDKKLNSIINEYGTHTLFDTNLGSQGPDENNCVYVVVPRHCVVTTGSDRAALLEVLQELLDFLALADAMPEKSTGTLTEAGFLVQQDETS